MGFFLLNLRKSLRDIFIDKDETENVVNCLSSRQVVPVIKRGELRLSQTQEPQIV